MQYTKADMVLELIKSFRPSKLATLILFALALLFAGMGSWQQKRAEEKEVIERQHELAKPLTLESAMDLDSRFSRISMTGHYDTNRHILLDNQIWQGQAGVYVLTPFLTDDGTAILINRGWLPLPADRKTMPVIPTPGNQLELEGMLNTLPVPGRILGTADNLKQDQWPQLVTYLNLSDISSSLKLPLENWVIQLSKSDQSGFEGRDWKPVFMSSSRHRGYAFQWFALVAASVIMWVYLGLRKSSGNNK